MDSVPGQGSTFGIYLPALFETPKEVGGETTSLSMLRGHGECILLVEDEDMVRSFTALTLRKNGYIVFEARNAQEGMEVFEKEGEKIHLVFSDVVLPDREGLDLVDSLLCRNPALKVLMCSGYIDQKSQLHFIQEKKYAFLQKPYSVPDMLRTVRTLIEKTK